MKKHAGAMRKRLQYFWGIYVQRDPFLLSIKKWFSDHGDEKLRLDYPLDQRAIVFDVGGYRGDFASAVFNKFGCRVYVFEPVSEFYHECVDRFANEPAIRCFNFGLSRQSAFLPMQVCRDESSVKRSMDGAEPANVSIRSIDEVFNELRLEQIDLMKINIEGGEYDLLPAMIEGGLLGKTRFVQVQFHNFVPNANELRKKIRNSLQVTHREMWNYEFVWESWERKE